MRGSKVFNKNCPNHCLDAAFNKSEAFNATGIKLFNFTIAQDLPTDDTQAVVVWSDAEMEIVDAMGNVVFAQGTDGDGPIGAGFSSKNLLAGAYTVRLEGTSGDDLQFSAGLYGFNEELEADGTPMSSNDVTPQPLGVLTATAPLYVFGTVDDLDTDDFFSFTVDDVNANGSDVNIIVEHFQLGVDIFDIDLRLLYRDMNVAVDGTPRSRISFDHPQVIRQAVSPAKVQTVRSKFYDFFDFDVPMGPGTSGDYMLRIRVATP